MTWMLTVSGIAFDVNQPDPDLVKLSDMSHHLSLINRFCGATYRPYSVAEHSCLVTEILERELGLHDPHGLLAGHTHDGHEAYFGDIIQPVKHHLGEVATVAELRLERAVQKRYGLTTPAAAYRQLIRRADLMALATERRDLLPEHTEPWACLTGIEPVTWVNLRNQEHFTWQDWREAFADKFNELNFARVRSGKAQGLASEEH
jgi:uncharacterized protein